MEAIYRVLTEAEIERIHALSLRILSEVGMRVECRTLCEHLHQQGLPVDFETRIVKVPAEVVEWALDVVPHGYCVYDRLGNEMDVRANDVYPSTYAESVKVLDYETRALRPSTYDDLLIFLRLGDVMPEVRKVCVVCWPTDLPQKLHALQSIAALMRTTAKFNSGAPKDKEEVEIWLDLAEIASPSGDLSERPCVELAGSPTSPLQLDADTAEVLMTVVGRDMPFAVAPCPMAGGTSPFTLAGTLLQGNAENLFMITACQLLREGARVRMGGAHGLMDLRTGSLSYGCPERHLMLGANIQLADHYGLPHSSPAGSVDAWYPDVQSGAEKMLTWIARLPAGIVSGIGFGSVFNGVAVSAEQMVIDADLLSTAQRALRGMDVSEETLAFEAIKRVGPGGDFLTDEHTLRFIRSGEHYYSPLVNRSGPEGVDMMTRAHERVQELLAQYECPVPAAVVQEIERYVADRTEHTSPED